MLRELRAGRWKDTFLPVPPCLYVPGGIWRCQIWKWERTCDCEREVLAFSSHIQYPPSSQWLVVDDLQAENKNEWVR